MRVKSFNYASILITDALTALLLQDSIKKACLSHIYYLEVISEIAKNI